MCIAEAIAALRAPDATPKNQLTALAQLQRLAWESEPNKTAIASGDGLSTLLSLLGHSSNLVRWHAAEVLSLLALIDSLRDAIVETYTTTTERAGTVTGYVVLGSTSLAGDSIRSAASSSSSLTSLSAARDVFRRSRRRFRDRRRGSSEAQPSSSGAHAKRALALTTVLCGRQASEEVRVAAAWGLWVLALDPTLRTSVLCKGAICALVAMLSAASGSASHVAAARLLRSLALADEVHLLFTHGAVTALVVTMCGATSPDARMAACSALCNFEFAVDDTTVSLIASLNVLPVVLALLQAPDPHWQGWAARFLRNLAPGLGADQLILSSGVLRPLANLLAPVSPTGDEHCQLTACSALYKMLETSAMLKTKLAEMGLAAELAAVARNPRTSYALRFVAARTLTELAVPENFGSFCDANVLAAIEMLLQDECEHCQYFAAVSLLNVGHTAGCIPLKAADDGTIRGLIRLLASAGPQHRTAAAAVLRHLSRIEVNRPLLVKLGAIHALLDVCCSDGGRCPLEAAGALQAIARSGSFYRREVLSACQNGAIADAAAAAAAAGADGEELDLQRAALVNMPFLLGCL